MTKTIQTLTRPTPWHDVVLVCRKCGKKLRGGFGEKRKQDLKTVLLLALRAAGRRRDVRVMEMRCLGVCPKAGVTALNATHPSLIHVIPAGAEPDDALRTLLGDRADARRVEAAGLSLP